MGVPLKWAVGDRCRWGANTYRIKEILKPGTRMRHGEVLKNSLARIEPEDPERIMVRLDSLELALDTSGEPTNVLKSQEK